MYCAASTFYCKSVLIDASSVLIKYIRWPLAESSTRMILRIHNQNEVFFNEFVLTIICDLAIRNMYEQHKRLQKSIWQVDIGHHYTYRAQCFLRTTGIAVLQIHFAYALQTALLTVTYIWSVTIFSPKIYKVFSSNNAKIEVYSD